MECVQVELCSLCNLPREPQQIGNEYKTGSRGHICENRLNGKVGLNARLLAPRYILTEENPRLRLHADK
eukprot:scaffold1234_cov116-Skeletonema_dohrnii-CCMP3373.AAC.1